MLTPDRSQIEMFVDGLFRQASPQGFVSVRAFLEGNSTKPFRISAAKLTGGLRFLVDVAEDDAYRAANFPLPVVFCPPIAVFTDKNHARERDIVEGLALSVECDQHPREARAKLELVLGPATMVVRSGGKWTDTADEVHDKLHLHWRLCEPARGPALSLLKKARDVATRYVGGDPSNKPVCHPIRWPGSWHRKAEPILCVIDTASPDFEIDLATALSALNAACPSPSAANGNGKDHSGPAADWVGQVASIIGGDGYHAALAALAAKMLVAGMSDGAAVNMLRALMESSTAARDSRWETRYADIPRAVKTARIKFGGQNKESALLLQSTLASTIKMTAIDWLWPDRFARGKIGLLVGLPDVGKGQIFAYMAATTTRGGAWPCDEGIAVVGNVIMLGAEDDPSDTVVPRLVAAGADLDRIHIVKMVQADGKDRMFSLVTDLALLRAKIIEVGNVKLVLIDPISAYLGVGKIDSFRTTDVRAVLGPVVDLAAELQVAIVGIMHFNKKTDVTNALLRISDSLAFGATARHVYAVVDDPENKRKLMVKGKNNHAKSGQKALAYNFGQREVADGITAPHILWHVNHVDVTAVEAMQASKSPAARDDTKKFLADMLASGPKPSAEIEEAAEANGISRRTLFRAKSELAVTAKKDGENGAWRWHATERGQSWYQDTAEG